MRECAELTVKQVWESRPGNGNRLPGRCRVRVVFTLTDNVPRQV
jgi:hypothetical protein